MSKSQIKKILSPAASREGFTVIELLVVISLMGLLMSAILVDFAGLRVPRNLTIAQNEMVTNFRALQSNTFSSRVVNGQAAQYYVAKMDLSNPTVYLLQAITSVNSPPAQVTTVQTISLPEYTRIRAVSINGVPITSGCVLLSFQLPYAKVIMRDGCSLPSPPSVSTGDDYDKLISYVNNGANSAVSDQPMQITISDAQNTRTKTITISGLTGLITPQ